MLLSHVVGVLARRWIIAMLGLVATAGLAVAAVQLVPPEQSLTATVLLVPPVDSSEPRANPYLSLGGLTAPTEVLARAMSDPATEKALRAQGATGTWTVERDYMTSAPILIVTTQDTSAASAQKTSDAILKLIPSQLQTLQAAVNVPTSAMITSSVVNQNADQKEVLKPLIRALMVIVFGGVILTVGLAAVVDAVVQRRKKGMTGRRRVPSRGTPGARPDVRAVLSPSDAREPSAGEEAPVAPRRYRPRRVLGGAAHPIEDGDDVDDNQPSHDMNAPSSRSGGRELRRRPLARTGHGAGPV